MISIIFIAGLYLIDIFDEALSPALSSSASIDIKDNDGDIKTENNNFRQIALSDFTNDSKINKSIQEFNYTSEILPLDISYQSSGINNTKGRYVKIIIDDDNSMIKQYASIREISVYVVPPAPEDFYKINKERWNESFPYYPHILTITNSSGTMANVPLTTISDGDSDPIRNPNYRLPRDPVINLKAGEPFEVSIDWDHIEGIGTSMILAVNENRSSVSGSTRNTYNNDDGGQMLTINSLNDTNAIYEGKNPKHFVFVPQTKNNSTGTPIMIPTGTYTLTIFVAIADDTSINFQTKILSSS
jgi:hypothetical protein